MLNNKTVLITGGTGSFGKEFVKIALKKFKKIKKLIVFSRDELKQYEMKKIFDPIKYPNMRYFIGDIRDYNRLKIATKEVDFIVHAAALKQVDTAEYNPFEYVKTNVMGAQNLIECALENKVKKVIFLSTDKAVSPINLYGATKLCADKIALASNNYKGKIPCVFSVVRYGNVTASRGSVIPFFKEKLKNNQIVSVTNQNMTRFNISLEEGVDMVLWALKNACGKEIIVPKISSYKLSDIIKALEIKKYKLIGLRPGEKIHEELINSDESLNTLDIGKYYIVLQDKTDKKICNYYTKKFKGNFFKNKFSYNSENANKLSISELKKIIKNN
jgi:UDP-N-acetylglucosamine 4,6-dehydratase (inverting)